MARSKKTSKKSSKKKSAKRSKAVAKKSSTGTALVSYREQLAALAEQESDRALSIGGGTNSIRLSKGKFRYRGEDLGETLDFVCVDFVKCRNYFDEEYDEDNPTPPACFALSPSGKNMVPHGTSPKKQGDDCDGCWANEFETDRRGRGKACRESYLLGTVHPDELEALAEGGDVEVAYLRVPPTSLAAWDSFMVKRNKVFKLPALAFIVQASFDEDVDYQKLEFEELGRVGEDYLPALIELRETVHEVLMTPPDVSNYGKKKKKTSKKNKKKSRAKKRSRR